MAYIEINSTNFGTITQMLQFPSLNMPSFYPLIFFGLFVIITLASYFEQKERIGTGNLMSSLAVSGIAMIVIAVMSRLLNLISSLTMIIILVIGSIFGIIYVVNRRP